MEIWAKISGYDNYFVSTIGRVKNINTGRILKQGTVTHGYLAVNLFKHNIGKTKKVHRLVAQTFIPNPKLKEFVNHKDFNKSNNNIDNLEWVTPKENSHHAKMGGRLSGAKRKLRGESNANCKISDQQIKEMLLDRANGSRLRELSAKYKTSISNISMILNRKRRHADSYVKD